MLGAAWFKVEANQAKYDALRVPSVETGTSLVSETDHREEYTPVAASISDFDID